MTIIIRGFKKAPSPPPPIPLPSLLSLQRRKQQFLSLILGVVLKEIQLFHADSYWTWYLPSTLMLYYLDKNQECHFKILFNNIIMFTLILTIDEIHEFMWALMFNYLSVIWFVCFYFLCFLSIVLICVLSCC